MSRLPGRLFRGREQPSFARMLRTMLRIPDLKRPGSRRLWVRRLLLPAVALLAALGARAQPQPWRVCLPDLQAPPYLNNAAQRLGVSERLLVDAGEAAGLAVQLSRQPIRRCRQLMELAQVESTLAAHIPSNLSLGQFPLHQGRPDTLRRVAHLRLVWVRRVGSRLDWDGQRLLGLAPTDAPPLVGVRRSMESAIEPVLALGLRVDEGAFGTAQLLEKLLAGRVDLALGLEEEMRQALRAPELRERLQLLPRPLRQQDYYAVLAPGLTPQARRLGERWWDEIARLRDLPPYRPD